MLEREIRAIRVLPFAAEPTGRETLLRLAFQRQVPTKQRSQHRIALDTVVQAGDQGTDRQCATDSLEQITVDEGVVSFRVSQQPTMFQAKS